MIPIVSMEFSVIVTIDKLDRGISVIVIVGRHENIFVAEICHDCGVATCLHLVFVPDNGKTTPLLRNVLLHPHKLINNLSSM
jgi:hypothetical protein